MEESDLESDEQEQEIVGERVNETDIEIPICKSLKESEVSECLHTLGKCHSGLGYAYLGVNVSNRGLTDVSVILGFKYLLYVDVSGNELTTEAIQILCAMKYLLILRADHNKLVSAQLKPIPYLQILSLNGNKLRNTLGICHELLERLELKENKIEEIQLDFNELKNLKVLELRGNLLSTTSGIYLPGLVRLYLAENMIEKLVGFDSLPALKVLHLRGNRISNLDGFGSQCNNLSYLNLRGNRIREISELQKLSCLSGLETLILLENPAFESSDEEETAYRCRVLALLPQLKRIDKDPVVYEEREEAAGLRDEMSLQMN